MEAGGEQHPAAEPRAVAAAAHDAEFVLDLAAVALRVLQLLPPDSRARAACVRRAWRAAAADPAAWAELDFRGCAVGPLTVHQHHWTLEIPRRCPPTLVVDETLAALCARAGAGLRTLRCDDDACGAVTVEGILAALRGGGCVGVRQLGMRKDYFYCYYPNGTLYSGFQPPMLTLATARQLLAVCPLLERTSLAVSDGLVESAQAAAALPGPLSVIPTQEQGAVLTEAHLRFATLPSVAELDLAMEGCHIGDVGAVTLARALRSNAALLELELGETDVGDEGGVALAEALHENTTLTTLHLFKNRLGAGSFAAFARALRMNCTLSSLDLAMNEGKNQMAALADALRVNSTLTFLNLYSTGIDAVGVTWLAAALCANTALASVYFDCTDVGDAGAASLAYALRVNSTLTLLNLCETHIGDAGAASLAEALHVNTTLTSLDLSEYQDGAQRFSAEVQAALREAQQANGTLKTLELA